MKEDVEEAVLEINHNKVVPLTKETAQQAESLVYEPWNVQIEIQVLLVMDESQLAILFGNYP